MSIRTDAEGKREEKREKRKTKWAAPSFLFNVKAKKAGQPAFTKKTGDRALSGTAGEGALTVGNHISG